MLKNFFKKHNFFLNADQNVFCDKKIIITIYVNDLFIIDFNKKVNINIKIALNKRFQIINLEFIAYYLGIRLDKNKL